MRRNPHGDHHCKDAEDTGKHTNCKHVREKRTRDACQRRRHQKHKQHQSRAAEPATHGDTHPRFSALDEKLFRDGGKRLYVHDCA